MTQVLAPNSGKLSLNRRFLAYMAVIAAAVFLYGRTVNFGFIEHDDDRNIYENHRILNPTAEHFSSYWKEPYLGLYIPATYTYWTGLSLLSSSLSKAEGVKKPDPKWFHLGNVVIHAANGILVLTLLHYLGFSVIASAFGALLFVAHPLQVEAVAWASGAKDVWSTFWGLLSLVTFARFMYQSSHRRLTLSLSYLCYAAAILSKPSQVVIPGLCALLLYYKDSQFRFKRFSTLIPYGLLLCGYLALANLSQEAEGSFKPVPLILRPLVAGDAINFYGWKTLLPTNLAVDYARHPFAVISDPIAIGLSTVTLLILAALVVCTFKTKNQSLKHTLVIAGLFVVSLVPVLGLVPFGYQFFSTVCDRYAYLATIAPSFAVALLTMQFSRSHHAVALAISCYLVGLSVASARQINYWKNETALFSRSLEVEHNGAVALIGISNEFAKKGDWQSTLPILTRASRALPDWARPHNNLGTTFVNLNRYGEAADALANAVKLRPLYPLAWSNRCSVLRQLKRLEESAHDCKIAAEQAPEFAPAHLNLALTLAELGDWPGAEFSYSKALALDPTNYDSLFFWASALRDRGDFQKASAEFTKLSTLYPGSEEAKRELEQTIRRATAATAESAKN